MASANRWLFVEEGIDWLLTNGWGTSDLVLDVVTTASIEFTLGKEFGDLTFDDSGAQATTLTAANWKIMSSDDEEPQPDGRVIMYATPLVAFTSVVAACYGAAIYYSTTLICGISFKSARAASSSFNVPLYIKMPWAYSEYGKTLGFYGEIT